MDNIEYLSPARAIDAAFTVCRAGRVPFVWGPPGISKSASILAQATADNRAFIDLRLSQMEPTDLRGIPVPNDPNAAFRTITWAAPETLPRDLNIKETYEIKVAGPQTIHFSNPLGVNNIRYVQNIEITATALGKGVTAEVTDETPTSFDVSLRDSNGEYVKGAVRYTVKGASRTFIALEEFNSAPPSVVAASYQFVLDKRLGEYIVPEDTFMMALGNRDSDKGQTFRLLKPVANRFIHLYVDADFKEWQRWAIANDVEPDIIGYLTAFEDHLMKFNPTDPEYAFPTPRSWTFLSDILKSNPNMSRASLMPIAVGAIGKVHGPLFVSMRDRIQTLPSSSSILDGTVTKFKGENGKAQMEPDLSYATATNISFILGREQRDIIAKHGTDGFRDSNDYKAWCKRADNFCQFAQNSFQLEIMIMALRLALKTHGLKFVAASMPVFKQILADNSKILSDR